MSPQPVAYVRRSSADAGSPGDISRDVQERAVRELAERDGHNGAVRIFVDWARSADEEKEAKRTAFRAMLAEVERGNVSVIYAYALDRLHRSVTQTAKLVTACQRHDVRIVTQREGEVQHDTPDAWLRFTTLATFAEYELRIIKKRSASALERRRDRGDVFGHAPYGYQHVKDATGRIVRVRSEPDVLAPVLQAVREAGSVLGACRLLKDRGVPAPKGGTRWATSALTRILEREAPELLPRRGPTGRRTPTNALLAQLVRCHCGTVMTPNRQRGQLYCGLGHIEGAAKHGKYNVREVDLLPWIRAEAARFKVPGDLGTSAVDDGQRTELEAQRERLGIDVVKGLLSPEKVAELAAEIDEQLQALDTAAQAIELPQAIKWDRWAPGDINAVLRTYWEYVGLDEQMRPVLAEWRLPAEYVR